MHLIDTLTDRIVQVAHPLQVILFGSHARSEAQGHSDVDLLVVIPDGGDKSQAWDQIRDAVRKLHFDTDIVVATQTDIARHGGLVGMVYRPALREGKVLYDALGGGGLEVEPVTEGDRTEQTRVWLGRAMRDLSAAEKLRTPPDPDWGIACYFAQQAAEKALKAILVFLQTQYPFTHDLDEIRNGIPVGWRLKEEYPNLQGLSEWALKGRYPGKEEPTEEDAQGAIDQARAIYESVRRDLRHYGFEMEPGGPVAR